MRQETPIHLQSNEEKKRSVKEAIIRREHRAAA